MPRFTLACIVILYCSTTAMADLPSPPKEMVPWPTIESPGDPGEASAADWIDAPAGRLGGVVVKDGHFFTGNYRLRLWGVNLAFGANFPTHAEADRLAVRFRRFGINAVRFHHMDNQPFPNGIFADQSLTNLSGEALDRLDYFVSVLKAQGIYADLNLHVSRNYRHYHAPAGGDGPAVDKIVDLFDPELIAAQKQYAHDLLTHVNPYTVARYSEEPAVAIVEINNENSFFMWGSPQTIAGLPQPYSAELERQWNGWLSNRYKTDGVLRTAWAVGEQPIGKAISDDPTFLSGSKNGRHAWAAEVHDPAGMTMTPIEGGGITLAVSAIDGTAWHLQFKQGGLRLTKGAAYVVRMTARADRPVDIDVSVGQDHSPWQSLGLGATAHLTTTDQTIDLPFTAAEADDNGRVSFSVGREKAVINITRAELIPGGRLGLGDGQSAIAGSVDIITPRTNPTTARHDDWYWFLEETEKKYYDGMRQYVKTDLGVKCPVTGTIGFGPMGTYAQRDMDFVDGHSYWEHPSFPHKQWDMNDWRIDNTPMVDHPGSSTFWGLAGTRVAGKPYTVTEYQHPAPNDWRAESLPMIASFAARQDWDGVFIFAYSHNSDYAKQKISSFFDIEGDPAKMAMMPMAARMFYGAVPRAWDAGTTPTPPPLLVGAEPAHMLDNALWIGPKADEIDRLLKTRTAVTYDIRGPAFEMPPLAASDGVSSRWTASGPGTGRYVLAGPNAGVFAGFAAGGKFPIDLGVARIESLQTPFASITIAPRDPHDVDTYVVTAVARVANTDMGWDGKRTTVGNHWGTGPLMIEPVKATIAIHGDWKHAHPLDAAGKPTADEVGSVVGGEFAVRLGEKPALAYVVTR